MIPLKTVLPVKDPENFEAQKMLSVRRNMDKVQLSEVRAVTKQGAYAHLKGRQLVSEGVIGNPADTPLNIYEDLFSNKNKKIKGEYLRKPKIKDLNLIEGIHDE
jgi:hypothetical protein